MSNVITSDDAQYAFDIVKAICTDVGPGLPGSSQERERAVMIKKELESHLGAGNVVVEEFTLAPGAFLGALPIGALFALVAALLNISLGRFTGVSPWLTALAALAFSIISPLPFILEFVLYLEVVDPLLKKERFRECDRHTAQAWSQEREATAHSEWTPRRRSGKYVASFAGLRILFRRRDHVHRIHRHAGDEHHPTDGRDYRQCRNRSVRNAGRGHPSLSSRAFHYLWHVLHSEREKRRNRARRGGQSLSQRTCGGSVQVPSKKPFLRPR